MANTNLLSGDRDYPGTAKEDNAQCQGKEREDYHDQEYGTYSDLLGSSLKQLDFLIWDSVSVDIGKTNRPS